MAKLNAKGEEIYKKWEQIYYDELHRLQAEKNDPTWMEGWCIIDCYRFAPEVEDEVELLVFGYDEYLPHFFAEQREFDSEADTKWYRDVHGNWFNVDQVESLARQYYDDYDD